MRASDNLIKKNKGKQSPNERAPTTMEYPFGHHSHHHHQRNDRDDEDQPPPPPPPHYSAPPPPYYQENEFAPPPPRRPPPAYYQEPEFAPPPPRPRPPPPAYYEQPEFAPPPPSYQEPGYPPPSSTHVTHVHHGSSYDRPPAEFGSSFNYQQPPPPTQVSHVSHEAPQTESTHNFFHPHLPSSLHHHSHSSSGSDSPLSNKPTVRVFCKAEPNFSLTIRDNKVVLAPSDSSDEFQHWYKDGKFSTRVKDEEGFPCFALVNKATGQAMKHSIGDTHPVQLIPYKPDVLDESILWTESKDTGDGYRAVRMVNNIRLNVDAFHGDNKSGGVHDGTTIVLWKWAKGDNQKWKIIPY